MAVTCSAICRKRHMKCDEAKPTCGPCAKGNRTCVYGTLEVDTSAANGRQNSITSANTTAASPNHSKSQHSFSSASDSGAHRQTSFSAADGKSDLFPKLHSARSRSIQSTLTNLGRQRRLSVPFLRLCAQECNYHLSYFR